ncbi:MAG: hypothetical protein EOP04_12670 [Proteobacteria bacterium]|nr:MAG: hypothetical protein EOP04_12670 [Pseudomonadota bacterium]
MRFPKAPASALASCLFFAASACSTVPDDAPKEYHLAHAAIDRAEEADADDIFPETIDRAKTAHSLPFESFHVRSRSNSNRDTGVILSSQLLPSSYNIESELTSPLTSLIAPFIGSTPLKASSEIFCRAAMNSAAETFFSIPG